MAILFFFSDRQRQKEHLLLDYIYTFNIDSTIGIFFNTISFRQYS